MHSSATRSLAFTRPNWRAANANDDDHRLRPDLMARQEFDYPYIARRALINGLKLPHILDTAGMKPWEIKDKLLDTMQLWKFGDFRSYTSLSLLCAVFNIPTPKDDIDGSQVARVYYEEGDLERIARYCEKDTLAVANLVLRFKREPGIEADHVEIIEPN